MSLQIIGLSYKTAPLEIRERLAFKNHDYLVELKIFTDKKEIREALLVSTCNRVELLLEADDDSAFETAVEFLSTARKIPRSEFEKYLYHHRDIEAVRHLFRVTGSLDSMSVGEGQISGQVREAYAFAAEEAGTVGRKLHKLMHHSFRAAKRVKSETRLAASGMSLSAAAVEEGREVFGSLKAKTILLVGAGEMAELAAKHLTQRGTGKILIANRTAQNAERLAREFGGKAIAFENLNEGLIAADVIICSTSAPDYLITGPMMQEAQTKRNFCPQFVIDLSVPRNVAPEIVEIANVFLSDVDGLQKRADENKRVRQTEIERAEQIVEEEAQAFWDYLPVLDKGEVLGLLRETMKETARREFERERDTLDGLSAEQLAAVENLVHRAVGKIAHPILYSLGRSRDAAAVEFAEILYTMLGETSGNEKPQVSRASAK